MTTFAEGKARNLALNSQGIVASTLDGANPSIYGYRPEYIPINLGNSVSLDETVRLTVSFDLVMTVATANPALQVYNSNNKGPMQLTTGVNALAGETHAVGETISKRVAVTGIWSPRSDANKPTNFLEFYSTYGTGNYFSISNLMVELGEVAHPWRPAPEDLEGASDMILATDTKTLAVAVDVQQVDTYYYQTASTGTAPSKPTAASPSGWQTAEYAFDASKAVWSCQKTTLTDGTFYWGAVSKWSAYDGSVVAWNKANAAQSAADEAAKVAGNYIVETASNDVWIHSEGHGPNSSGVATADTYGWRIGSVFELVRAGLSYFKMWVENSVAKVRVGLENAGHSVFSPSGMDIYTDSTSKVASIGETSIIGADGNLQLKMAPGALSLENNLDETVYSVSASEVELIEKSKTVATLSAPDKTSRTVSDPSIVDLQYVGVAIWPLGDERLEPEQYTATVTVGSGVTVALTQAGVDVINEYLDGHSYDIELYVVYNANNTVKATFDMDGTMSLSGQSSVLNVTNDKWSNTNQTGAWLSAGNSATGAKVLFGIGESGSTRGIWDSSLKRWMIYTAAGGQTMINGNNFWNTASGNLHLKSDDRSGLYQHCIARSFRLGAAAPSEDQYFGTQVGQDMNGEAFYYSETAFTTARDLYRSFVCCRRSSDGNTIYRNGFYLHVDNSGDPSVTFTTGGAEAWRDGLGASSGVWPASLGGTGQTSLKATRNAMGLGNTTGALPVANGGTAKTSGAFHSCTQLYNSTTGSNGTITLSAAVTSYDYLAIWTIDNNSKNPRISWIATRKAATTSTVMMFEASSNTGTLFRRVRYTISETSMTPSYGNYIQNTAPSTWTSGTAGTNYVKVTRVMGYII